MPQAFESASAKIRGMQAASGVFGLTFDSVANACRAARKLNMMEYQPTSVTDKGVAPAPVMMRAEVVW